MEIGQIIFGKLPDKGACDPGTTLTADDETPDTIGSNYLIERQIGEKYFYNEGNTYAFGGDNDYEYGNCYAENIVKEADWPNTGGGYDNDDYDGMDPDETRIEKTIGDTYSYQKGKNREIMVGDVHSRHYGKEYSYHKGNADSRHWGLFAFDFSGCALTSTSICLATTLFDIIVSGLKIDFTAAIATVDIILAPLQLEINLSSKYKKEITMADVHRKYAQPVEEEYVKHVDYKTEDYYSITAQQCPVSFLHKEFFLSVL